MNLQQHMFSSFIIVVNEKIKDKIEVKQGGLKFSLNTDGFYCDPVVQAVIGSGFKGQFLCGAYSPW